VTRALVTGAAGFVGAHLSRALLERGYDVRGFDNFDSGDRETVASLQNDDAFEFLEGDLRDAAAVATAVEDVDHVYHQAAVASVPRSVEDPEETTAVNAAGTTTLLTAARDAGVEKVVVASSSAVYGSDAAIPAREDATPDCESPYALSKYWTEQLALQYDDLYGLETVALRYFNIYGPGQDPESDYASVIPLFVSRMGAGDPPIVFGDGEQSRDFVYVSDVVEANVLAMESDVHGEVFNVATGTRVTVNELVEALNGVLGTEFTPEYDDPRPGDVRHSGADISKARDLLGFEPQVEFAEGLERTVEDLTDRPVEAE
jgi:UDP-N-acetylglucosamine 4-epimerase